MSQTTETIETRVGGATNARRCAAYISKQMEQHPEARFAVVFTGMPAGANAIKVVFELGKYLIAKQQTVQASVVMETRLIDEKGEPTDRKRSVTLFLLHVKDVE